MAERIAPSRRRGTSTAASNDGSAPTCLPTAGRHGGSNSPSNGSTVGAARRSRGKERRAETQRYLENAFVDRGTEDSRR
jgi:hypothetical protein